MLTGIGDAELDRHDIEKWRIDAACPAGPEIIADLEFQAVGSGCHVEAAKKRLVGTAVRVRLPGGNEIPHARARNRERERHVRARQTGRRVEDVCGQAAIGEAEALREDVGLAIAHALERAGAAGAPRPKI